MVLVKILGLIDFASAIAFLMLIFGYSVPMQFALFCAGLLLLKSMFLLTGDVLSFIDLISGISLILSLFFVLPSFLIWSASFLLLAKAFVSFM